MRRNVAVAVALLAALVPMLTPSPAVRAQNSPSQLSVLLAVGWNNIAYAGPTRPVGQALAQIAGRYESVWMWEPQAQRWLGVNPLAPPIAADFAELRQNQAYWIRMTQPGELTMTVPPAQPGITLNAGWNNFMYQGAERAIAEALDNAGAAGRVDTVWRWDAARQRWNGFMHAAPAASDFTTLAPFRPYFMYLAAGPQVLLAAPVAAPVVSASPAPSRTPTATAAPGPGVAASATPSATPKPQTCYSFTSYQPQIAEVNRAQNRAGHGLLLSDADFKIADLETQVDGNGQRVTPFVPPTLLKAIAWIESGWRQASFATARGSFGSTVVSTSCAYGLMQILTGMDIDAAPTPKQQRIGADYVANIAAGAQLLGIKWNLGPDTLPVVLPRNPRAVEDWYFAVWAYHCFGDVCQALGIHNNPEDPALKWPRPAYNSPEQLASAAQLGYADYPYQELVYGVLANPPKVNGAALWTALPAQLPPRGAVGFPEPHGFLQPSYTLDATPPDAQ